MRELLRREEGQTVVEYGVLLALILGVVVVMVEAVGLDLLGLFQDAANAIS